MADLKKKAYIKKARLSGLLLNFSVGINLEVDLVRSASMRSLARALRLMPAEEFASWRGSLFLPQNQHLQYDLYLLVGWWIY